MKWKKISDGIFVGIFVCLKTILIIILNIYFYY